MSSETTVQDPLKPWKYLLSLPIKFSFSTTFMKSFGVIFIFAATSLIFYSAFPTQNWLSCSECDQSFIHTAGYDYHQPDNEKTNISHILFGIGGSAKTWSNRRRYSEIWWRPNYTRGFVWLDEKPAGDTAGLENSPPYKVSEDTSKFKYTCSYGSRSAIRIARIVKESFQLGLGNVRWFVMGDDDTVFFTGNLVNVLAKYDHNQMYYIGGNSESVKQDVVHSYTMAYGGGGFAISYPLAAELVRVLDGCIDRYASFYGSDQKIGGCMTEIGVPLTKELGFHQLDIRGNPYGLLAAHPLAPLVSLHHLDYVQPLFPDLSRRDSVKKLVDAYKNDPSRAVQHSFCYDRSRNWSISISWGYTVQLYPTFVTAKDLSTPLQTFLTWISWDDEPFTFNTRPMNLKPCRRPVIYYYDRVDNLRNGQTLTSYKRPVSEMRSKQCDNKEYTSAYSVKMFNVTAAVFDPELWKKVIGETQSTSLISSVPNKFRAIEIATLLCINEPSTSQVPSYWPHIDNVVR